MITIEQEKNILQNLRRPENDKEIAEIAFLISKEYEKVGGTLSPDLAYQTALLMNMGETDPRIAHIYEPSYNWKEHPEAIELNKLHGKYSIEIAEKMGISLSDEQKEVIEGHSKGEYKSTLAQIIKIAEICRATESPRWYRGEKKEAAKSWQEVYEVLKEDPSLNPAMIVLAASSYGKKHFKTKENEVKDNKKNPIGDGDEGR